MFTNKEIERAMQIKLDGNLPEYPVFEKNIRRAPKREANLSKEEVETALKNALRYIPEEHHAFMAEEFLQELN